MTDWQKVIEEFQEVRVARIVHMDFENTGTPDTVITLIWEYIGEGFSGDYQPDDLDDVPLLRFTLMEPDPDEGESFSRQVEDASYCTLMPVDTSRTVLKKAANLILDTVAHNIAVNSPYKRDLERLSWIDPESVERTEDGN